MGTIHSIPSQHGSDTVTGRRLCMTVLSLSGLVFMREHQETFRKCMITWNVDAVRILMWVHRTHIAKGLTAAAVYVILFLHAHHRQTFSSKLLQWVQKNGSLYWLFALRKLIGSIQGMSSDVVCIHSSCKPWLTQSNTSFYNIHGIQFCNCHAGSKTILVHLNELLDACMSVCNVAITVVP